MEAIKKNIENKIAFCFGVKILDIYVFTTSSNNITANVPGLYAGGAIVPLVCLFRKPNVQKEVSVLP